MLPLIYLTVCTAWFLIIFICCYSCHLFHIHQAIKCASMRRNDAWWQTSVSYLLSSLVHSPIEALHTGCCLETAHFATCLKSLAAKTEGFCLHGTNLDVLRHVKWVIRHVCWIRSGKKDQKTTCRTGSSGSLYSQCTHTFCVWALVLAVRALFHPSCMDFYHMKDKQKNCFLIFF